MYVYIGRMVGKYLGKYPVGIHLKIWEITLVPATLFNNNTRPPRLRIAILKYLRIIRINILSIILNNHAIKNRSEYPGIKF